MSNDYVCQRLFLVLRTATDDRRPDGVATVRSLDLGLFQDETKEGARCRDRDLRNTVATAVTCGGSNCKSSNLA
jgi:hypothetical protein